MNEGKKIKKMKENLIKEREEKKKSHQYNDKKLRKTHPSKQKNFTPKLQEQVAHFS